MEYYKKQNNEIGAWISRKKARNYELAYSYILSMILV